MQKDVVYIDVEDDITAIIGKLKASKHKVVAFVPPKRVGVLQSAVNLRLLARAASQNKKHVVVVTSNQALSSLAASAKIPVAKNLQSKPELAEIAALEIDDGEDVIDGGELPEAIDKKKEDVASGLAAVATGDVEKATPPEPGEVAPKAKVKKASKVPNFNTFRKKLLLGGGIAALLIGFLVWALVFAPSAKVILKTRTTAAAVNQPVTIGTGVETSADKTTIKAESRQFKKAVSVEFTATGEKDVGTKAKGQVKFSTSQIPALGTVIAAGTELATASGATYATDSSVTIGLSNYTGAYVGITAVANGDQYNGASGALSGAPSGISASVSQSTTGGTSKKITTVAQSDIDGAKDKVDEGANLSEAKTNLANRFGSDYLVLIDAVESDAGGVQSSIAVDSEATNGKAVLQGEVVYTMYGVKRDQLAKYLDSVVASQIDNKNEQKVYDNGSKDAKLLNVRKEGDTLRAELTTNGKIGPIIDEQKVKDIAKGKGFGEVQSELDALEGVEDVDIKFSPFWVRSVPNNDNKITVEFILDES